MFNNIGEKIKKVAEFIFGVGIMLSVIISIDASIKFANAGEEVFAVLAVIFGIPLGILVSWLSVLLLYGFGELIEQTQEGVVLLHTMLAREKAWNAEKAEESTKKNEKSYKGNTEKNDHKWLCQNCGQMRSESPCPHCGDKS